MSSASAALGSPAPPHHPPPHALPRRTTLSHEPAFACPTDLWSRNGRFEKRATAQNEQGQALPSLHYGVAFSLVNNICWDRIPVPVKFPGQIGPRKY